ncbi:MAG: HU family DNA-binding protein [Prevotella sp.]|nr:HU family DNA-binding protein [Prevotella sp.]
MSHLYKLVQNTNEHLTGAYQKWYARPVYTGTIDLDGIAEKIQRNSTAKKSDAKAVLTEMVEVITDALQASQRVHINGFGTFKVGLSSKGVSTVKDFSILENLKGVRVLFQPETSVDKGSRKRVRPMLQNLSFQNSADLANAKEVEERSKDEEQEP